MIVTCRCVKRLIVRDPTWQCLVQSAQRGVHDASLWQTPSLWVGLEIGGTPQNDCFLCFPPKWGTDTRLVVLVSEDID